MNTNEWDFDESEDDWDEEWDSLEDFPEPSFAAEAELNHSNDESGNGQRVRDLRMMVDMSPEALADYALINVKDLLAIEAGVQPLERSLAQLLADGIGVQINDIWVEKDLAA